MGKVYSREYELNYYDVDSNLRATMSTIINILSDIGTKQSEELGWNIDTFTKNNMGWVFYNYDIKIYRSPVYGEKLKVKTQAVGLKKFYALRSYEIRDKDDEIIVEGNAIFLLINIEKRKTMRVPEILYKAYGIEGDMDGEFKLPRLTKINEFEIEKDIEIRYTDIDSNKHVNNTKYIDWAVESLSEEIVNNYILSNIQVIFEKECKYGDKIKVFTNIIKEENGDLTTIHKIENKDSKTLTRLVGVWKKA